MKIENLSSWEAFQAIAVHGGYSKAAKVLRVGVPQLSKRISKLEDQLGARLFARSTRVVSLTDEGKSLLPRVNSLLEDCAALGASLEGEKELSGTIYVASVPFIGQRFLIPILKEFLSQHPGVRIELELSENRVNLLESNIDLAFRIESSPGDSSAVYRKLLENRLVLCASPAYLKASKAIPKTPKDLRNHEVLLLDVHESSRFEGTSLRLGDVAKTKRVACDNGWLLTELALQDFGILVRSIWDVRDYLKSGALVQILKNHPIEAFGHIYAVIPNRRHLAPRIRAFLEFASQRIKSHI